MRHWCICGRRRVPEVSHRMLLVKLLVVMFVVRVSCRIRRRHSNEEVHTFEDLLVHVYGEDDDDEEGYFHTGSAWSADNERVQKIGG